MKKWICLLLCLLFLCGTACAEEYRSIPDCMRFSVAIGSNETLSGKTHLRRSYPRTALPAVDAELAGLIDGLAALASLQPVNCKTEGYLDVTCRIQRSGQSAMSFLVLAARVEDKQQTGIAFENRVFDMEDGRRILLPHLFSDGNDVWDVLQQEAYRQISAYYPQQDADEEALNALCRKESLQDAAFSLTPAQLEIHFPAAAVYEGRQTVMHVRIPFRTLRPYLSDYGYRQTNNIGYQLAALTYDDGPVRNASLRLMDTLMAHGAGATFFVVGSRIRQHTDIISREQDSGFTVASHNYIHTYDVTDPRQLLEWKDKFEQDLMAVTGTVPTIMRAPGGSYGKFQAAQTGLPLIQWDVLTGDATTEKTYAKMRSIANTGKAQTKAGSVVLMHDLNYQSPQYSQEILEELERKNILCVTVEDLFLHYGVPLEPDMPHYSCADLIPPEY